MRQRPYVETEDMWKLGEGSNDGGDGVHSSSGVTVEKETVRGRQRPRPATAPHRRFPGRGAEEKDQEEEATSVSDVEEDAVTVVDGEEEEEEEEKEEDAALAEDSCFSYFLAQEIFTFFHSSPALS